MNGRKRRLSQVVKGNLYLSTKNYANFKPLFVTQTFRLSGKSNWRHQAATRQFESSFVNLRVDDKFNSFMLFQKYFVRLFVEKCLLLLFLSPLLDVSMSTLELPETFNARVTPESVPEVCPANKRVKEWRLAFLPSDPQQSGIQTLAHSS